MKLIVGLGNPGIEYEKNRHNIGFIMLDKYLKKNNINGFKEKFQSLYLKDNNIIYQKPLTYMNLSGNAIKEIINFFKIDPKKDLLVIYDDMDLKIGEVKIKNNGSSAGHNGIKSIISQIGEEFIRLKIGIDKPLKNKTVISHVLGNFTEEEKNQLTQLEEHIFKIIKDFNNDENIEVLMSKYNKKIKNKKEAKIKLQKAKQQNIQEILKLNNKFEKEEILQQIQTNNSYILQLDTEILAYTYLEKEENINNIKNFIIKEEYLIENFKEFIEKLIRISFKESIFNLKLEIEENIILEKKLKELKFNKTEKNTYFFGG